MSTVEYNSALDVIEIVHAGLTSAEDLRKTTTMAIALINERGVLDVLLDATTIDLRASLVDVYNLPAEDYEAEKLDRRACVGLVLPESKKGREFAEFYETACSNRGWNVRSFSSRDEAINWLKGGDSARP